MSQHENFVLRADAVFRRGSLCKGYKIKRIGNTFHMETDTRLHKIWGKECSPLFIDVRRGDAEIRSAINLSFT